MSAKLLSMFHCSLGGTIFIYQGQEWGICNVPRLWGEEEYKDIETIQEFESERKHRQKNGQANPDVSDVLRYMRQTARDNGRTPVQVSCWACPSGTELTRHSGTTQPMLGSQKVLLG